MNYYEHHLGDYIRDAGHLSMLEDGAYRRLLDAYYVREEPLPAPIKDVCRVARALSKAERAAVETVLREFFDLREDGWHHSRCDREIERYIEKRAKAKRSADARWSAKQSNNERSADGMRTHSEGNALQTPDTRHQTPRKKDRGAGAPPMAFVGKVIRLTAEDYERWKTTFHAVPDMHAELTAADAHYADKPPKDGKWFFPVSSWLKRAHEQALAKQAEEASARRSWN